MNGRGTWTGALTDCAGRPTAEAMAAFAALAAPTHTDALGDLTPWVRAVRRIAPAAGWTLAESAQPARPARRTPGAPLVCPPGQEPTVASETEGPQRNPRTRERAHADSIALPNARRTAGAPHERTVRSARCVPIPVAHDPHTHDAVLTLGDGTAARALHPRLLSMLSTLAQRFPSRRFEIISGYRPSTNPHHGSRHAHARAIDFRISGVSRETLRDAARALPDAGVGYYPNSVFIHLDVRDASEGPARWTDYAGHGERARYGAWPPRDADVSREVSFLQERAQAALALLRQREGGESAAAPTVETAAAQHTDATPDEDRRAEEDATREEEAGTP